MARYKGDLAKFIVEAIMDVELDRVRLVVIDEAKIPDTTVRVEKPVFDRLASLAKRRNTSMNVLVNTAVAHWLESKRQRVRFVSE
jgi:predicted DNA-binding ribbon-helix-helix protein